MNNKFIEFLKPDFEFYDSRGSLVQVCHEGWAQVNVSTSKKGVTRGSHLHKICREAFFIIKGKAHLTLEKDNEIFQIEVRNQDFFILPTYVSHKFEFLEDTIMLVLYDTPIEKENGEKDIYIVE